MILLLLLACRDATLEDFLQARAEATCARHARCGTLELSGYGTEEGCVNFLEEAIDALRKRGQLDCPSYDADAADACIAVIEDTPCDEAPDLSVCDMVCQTR